MPIALHDNETILLELKPQPVSAWYWLFTRMWHVIWLAFLLLILVQVQFHHAALSQAGGLFSQIPIAPALLAFALLIGLGYLFFRMVVQGYDYTITNQRIILKYGFISLNTRIIPLNQISDVNMRANLIERLFGFGSVYIDCIGTISMTFRRSGAMSNTTRLEGISNADCEKAMEVISREIAKNKR